MSHIKKKTYRRNGKRKRKKLSLAEQKNQQEGAGQEWQMSLI